MVELYPSMGSVDIVKHQATEWNKLNDAQKSKYIKEALVDVERYKQARCHD